MATHIPYHRWILISKSIQSLSVKLCRRNQLTSDRNFYSQVPVTPWQALKTPKAKNQPRCLLWLGWGDGIRISPAAPSPKPQWMCVHRHVRGTLSATCARDRRSPLPADPSFSCLLFSSTTLQNLGAHRHQALLREKREAEKLFHIPSSWTSSAGWKWQQRE